MDILDRLLGHDVWTNRLLIELCSPLPDASLDTEFDIGHRTIRATLDHIIAVMEGWTGLMMNGPEWSEPPASEQGRTLEGMQYRLAQVEIEIGAFARRIQHEGALDRTFSYNASKPEAQLTYGGVITHIALHGMHHRAQLLYMLKKLGVPELPEGDVLTWEDSVRGIQP